MPQPQRKRASPVSDTIRDAKEAFSAWKEAPVGSYVERALADAIVRDIVPALIHTAEFPPKPLGFTDA